MVPNFKFYKFFSAFVIKYLILKNGNEIGINVFFLNN